MTAATLPRKQNPLRSDPETQSRRADSHDDPQRIDLDAIIKADERRRASRADELKAQIATDEPEAIQAQKDANAKVLGVANLKHELTFLGWESAASSAAKRRLWEGAEPIVDPVRRRIYRLQEEKRAGFGSCEVHERWPQTGEHKKTRDGRRVPVHVTNSEKINDYLARTKAALEALEKLVLSPLSLDEIAAAADQIVEDIGPFSTPAPILVDDQPTPVF
jgi:hypothetical protein